MRAISEFWKKYRFVLVAFLLWRLGLFFISYLSTIFIPFHPTFPYSQTYLAPSNLPDWFWRFGNFDGVHYLGIAKEGYAAAGTQVFFPLYPLAIRLLTILLPNPLLAALLVSNIFFLAGCLLFFNLVQKDFDKKTASWATAFLFLFPTSFFFGSIYTEGLFFFLVVASFYYRGLLSGATSLLAGMTRLVGLVIAPTLILFRHRNIWGVGALAGFLSYAYYLAVNFASPLAFLTGQAYFRNDRATSLTALVTPPQVIFRYLKIFLTADKTTLSYFVASLEFVSFVGACILLLWLTFRRKLRPSWLFFAWLTLLLPTFSGTLSSVPRYLLTIFPLFVGLSLLGKRFRFSLATVFILLQIVLVLLFTSGAFVS